MKTPQNKPVMILLGGMMIFSMFQACNFNESGLKKSSGAVNEILIVTNDKTQWEGAVGDSVRAVFAAEMPALTQPEPKFDLINIADNDFSDLFKKYHNIFIVNIDPQATEVKSETSQDAWAQPQRVVKITAPDAASFFSELQLKKESYLKLFTDLERKRTLTINQLSADMKLSREIEKKFGIYLPVTGGFYKAKETADFMWIRHKVVKAKQDIELSILIYTADYKNPSVFDPRHIIQWRNLVTRENIPGPTPISFMKVSEDYIPPVFDTINDFPGGFAVETRGLWEVENDFMGGVFISYTFVDKNTNKVITLDGYVYNPNDDKKNFLRQLEAIFFAMQFVSVK